jgi:hypothetical protein
MRVADQSRIAGLWFVSAAAGVKAAASRRIPEIDEAEEVLACDWRT